MSSVGALLFDDFEVNNLVLFEHILKTYYEKKVKCFNVGQLTDVHAKWRHIASDSEVLNYVKGQYIEFSSLPTYSGSCKSKTFNTSDSLVIEAEIQSC